MPDQSIRGKVWNNYLGQQKYRFTPLFVSENPHIAP
jgi:hypothetical protein